MKNKVKTTEQDLGGDGLLLGPGALMIAEETSESLRGPDILTNQETWSVGTKACHRLGMIKSAHISSGPWKATRLKKEGKLVVETPGMDETSLNTYYSLNLDLGLMDSPTPLDSWQKQVHIFLKKYNIIQSLDLSLELVHRQYPTVNKKSSGTEENKTI